VAGSAESSARRRRRLHAFVVLLVVALVYGRCVGHAFLIWDDNQNITDNPWLVAPGWQTLERFWSEAFFALYIPLAYTLFTALAALTGGPDPAVFHAANIGLHALATLWVLACLRRLVRDERAALFGALLFALHPLQVESAAWASEMRGTLAACFAFAALERYLASRAAPPGKRVTPYVWASAAFAAALLCKPSVVVLPAFALVLELEAGVSAAWQRMRWLVPWFVLAGADVLLTKALQGNEQLDFVTPLASRPLVALDALAFYLEKLLWPFGLGPDYGRSPQVVLAHASQAWVRAALVALVVLLIFVPKRTRAWFATCFALLVVAVLPVLGIVPFLYQDISTVADRYAYLALFAPALLLARTLATARGPWSAIAVSLGLALLALCSFRQAAVWRDTETLFARALAINPVSWIAYNNRGMAQLAHGELARAAAEFEQVLRLRPEHIHAHNNLGLIAAQQGRGDEALRHFHRALEIDPAYSRAHANLAKVLFQAGRYDEALRHARDAVVHSPRDADAHTTLGRMLLQRGNVGAAIVELRAALEHAPRSVDAHRFLARALIGANNRSEALAHYEELVREGLADRDTLIEFAWELAASATQVASDPPRALALAEQALGMGRDARALDTLARALAANGRAVEAQVAAREALGLARNEPDYARDIEQRLREYERAQ
jgi:protein O-mannosyl-transferase